MPSAVREPLQILQTCFRPEQLQLLLSVLAYCLNQIISGNLSNRFIQYRPCCLAAVYCYCRQLLAFLIGYFQLKNDLTCIKLILTCEGSCGNSYDEGYA